jgi:hypothetical protein
VNKGERKGRSPNHPLPVYDSSVVGDVSHPVKEESGGAKDHQPVDLAGPDGLRPG